MTVSYVSISDDYDFDRFPSERAFVKSVVDKANLVLAKGGSRQSRIDFADWDASGSRPILTLGVASGGKGEITVEAVSRFLKRKKEKAA